MVDVVRVCHSWIKSKQTNPTDTAGQCPFKNGCSVHIFFHTINLLKAIKTEEPTNFAHRLNTWLKYG